MQLDINKTKQRGTIATAPTKRGANSLFMPLFTRSHMRQAQSMSARERVDALIALQWQREHAKIKNIIQYNNPYYTKLKNYASQF